MKKKTGQLLLTGLLILGMLSGCGTFGSDGDREEWDDESEDPVSEEHDREEDVQEDVYKDVTKYLTYDVMGEQGVRVELSDEESDKYRNITFADKIDGYAIIEVGRMPLSVRKVRLPDGVVRIGEGAFEECKQLRSITIPDSVREIESRAFSGCSRLRSITIPASVQYLSVDVFSDCQKLSHLKVPSYYQDRLADFCEAYAEQIEFYDADVSTIVAEEAVPKEMVRGKTNTGAETKAAFDAYWEVCYRLWEDGWIFGIGFINVDDDGIPEMVLFGMSAAEGNRLYYYHDGQIQELILYREGFSYIENEGLVLNSEGHMGGYYDLVYRLKDGEIEMIGDGEWSEMINDGDFEYYYYWNGEEVDESTYQSYLSSIYDESKARSSWEMDRQDSLEAAYSIYLTENLDENATEYYMENDYLISRFELVDGILTVESEDNLNSGNGKAVNHISFPVADDCKWYWHSVTGESYPGEYEEFKENADAAHSAYREYGDEYIVESPEAFFVGVTDGEVTSVYVSIS